MRTDLILTTALLGVAGTLGASAQVYSVNAVGYINIKVPAKSLALVANQLNAGGNTVADVIPTLPDAADGSTVFLYAGAAGFLVNAFQFGTWAQPTQSVKPGVGFFLQNASAAELTVTLVGEVPQGTLSTPLVAGLNLVASQVPLAGLLGTDLKYTAQDQDTVYQWDVATQNYKSGNTYEFGAWNNGEPTVAVGEGFFLNRAAAGTWDRTFSVN